MHLKALVFFGRYNKNNVQSKFFIMYIGLIFLFYQKNQNHATLRVKSPYRGKNGGNGQ